MITDHLFVYGTLRREYGHPLYPLMMANGSSLGRATARGTLLAVSYYPALVRRGSGDGVVVGELIRLHSPDMILERFDRYEHISADDPLPHPYIRAVIPVHRSSGEWVQAWTYFWNLPVEGIEVIESGEYIEWWIERGCPRKKDPGHASEE